MSIESPPWLVQPAVGVEVHIAERAVQGEPTANEGITVRVDHIHKLGVADPDPSAFGLQDVKVGAGRVDRCQPVSLFANTPISPCTQHTFL